MAGTRGMLSLRLEATGEVRTLSSGTLSVGRTAGNAWVIDAARQPPRVSREHCCFAAAPAGFTVTDLASRNGTFLNGRRLPAGGSTPLQNGDVVQVADHRFLAEITADAVPGLFSPGPLPDWRLGQSLPEIRSPAPPVVDPGRPERDRPPLELTQPPEAGAQSLLEAALRSLIYDHAGASGSEARPGTDRVPHPLPLGPGPQDRQLPPDAPLGPADDWRKFRAGPENEALLPPPVAPQPATAQGGAGDALLAAFLAGAGLLRDQVDSADPVAFMREAGAMFTAMAEGYRQLLGVRRRIKADARLKRTQDGAEANNPLKSAQDGPEAALALLRSSPGAVYLRPRAAVRDAVQALTAHELAMLDAFQAALADLLETFDPRRLESRMGDGGGLAMLARGGRRANLWDIYVERHAEIARAARTRSLGAFDDAFRDAYERRAAAVEARSAGGLDDLP